MLPQDTVHLINDSLPSFGRGDVVLFGDTEDDAPLSLLPSRVP